MQPFTRAAAAPRTLNNLSLKRHKHICTNSSTARPSRFAQASKHPVQACCARNECWPCQTCPGSNCWSHAGGVHGMLNQHSVWINCTHVQPWHDAVISTCMKRYMQLHNACGVTPMRTLCNETFDVNSAALSDAGMDVCNTRSPLDM
jgi:hypothetical protein